MKGLLPLPLPLHLVLGLLLWCLWFVVIYAGLSVGCAQLDPGDLETPFNIINLSLLAVTLVTLLVQGLLALACWRQAGRTHGQTRFLARSAAGLYLLSAGATLAVGVPLLVLVPCY